MKLAQFNGKNGLQCGIIGKRGIYPTSASLEDIVAGKAALPEQPLDNRPEWISEDDVVYVPCIPAGKKIICVGLNYRKHAEEAGLPVPQVPILFNKFSNGPVGHQAEVMLASTAREYDYEAELGVVIGKSARDIGEEEALQYVFGYCNVNDLSARDLQMRTSQWMLGKIMDGFCPVGPYLVTAEEVGDPNELDIRLTLNGEVRQSSNTRDMIFSVPQIISYITKYMTLEPGDLILTGTPEGVIAGYPEDRKRWLKAGDIVTVEIEKLGALTNTMKGS